MLVLSVYKRNILGVYLTLCFLYCGRFVQYKATSLEKQHKHELLTEPDLGVTIDLINPDTYRIDPTSELESITVRILNSFYLCLIKMMFCPKYLVYLVLKLFWIIQTSTVSCVKNVHGLSEIAFTKSHCNFSISQ